LNVYARERIRACDGLGEKERKREGEKERRREGEKERRREGEKERREGRRGEGERERKPGLKESVSMFRAARRQVCFKSRVNAEAALVWVQEIKKREER